MNRHLPPGLIERKYKTRGGYRQVLYYCRFTCWDGVRRVLTKGIPDFKTATERLAELRVLDAKRQDWSRSAETPRATLGPWLRKFLEVKAGKRSARRDVKSAEYVKDFFGDAALADILPTRMLEYRRYRAGAEPSTVNRELAFLRSVLRMAFHDGALAKLPLFPFEAEHNERDRTAAPEEYRRILGELRKDLRGANRRRTFHPEAADVVEVLYEMGFRVGEVLKIQPRDLIPAARAIDMRRIRFKHGLRRPLPLTPRAWVILSRRAASRPATAPLYTLTNNNVHWAFKRACEMLKIKGLWVHDLRATFATEKERQGWPRKIIMEFTGHRTEYAFRRYSRPTMADLEAFAAGNALGKSPKARVSSIRK